MTRSTWSILLGTLGLGATSLVVVTAVWPPINVVETGRTPEYPDIQPRPYPGPTRRVFDAAVRAVDRLPRWTVVSSRPEQSSIRAEARTRILRFVDDVTIRIVPQGNNSLVHVRSASRIGHGDFGQNARNIRVFFEELDRQLSLQD